MTKFQWGLLVIVAGLSLAAGIPKVMRMAHEVQFFDKASLSHTWLTVLGVLQIVGGVLLIIPKTHLPGALIAAIGLFASAAVIFMTGDMMFATVSLIPVLSALYVARVVARVK